MIRVFEPKLNRNDYISIFKTLYKNNISGSSPTVQEFEKKLADKFDSKHAVALSNGSVALDVALNLLDLNEEDEVIIPSFTIISCLSAVIRSGAKPVFCDVDPISWNMTLEDVKNKISNKTRVVLMVHTYGLTAEAHKIKEFCTSNSIILIEDAAEAHGQIIDDKKCGSFGDMSTFSFYANKHITTGEGGAILSNNSEYAKKARQLINLDFNNNLRFQHNNLYWNHRMSGLQAALGISQIDNLDKVITKKIKQGGYYDQLLSNSSDLVSVQPKNFEGVQNHYWVFGILLKKEGIRDKMIKNLLIEGVETRPFFWPLHLQKALPQKFVIKGLELKVSENLGRNGLYIPIGEHVSKSDQNKIIEKLFYQIKNC
jgi:perosamine synthetase